MKAHPQLAIILIAHLAIAASVSGQDPAAASSLAPEQFAILPWGGTPADPAVLADIKACGFNLAGFVSPDGLDAVAAAGLKAIVSGLHVDDSTAGLDEAEVARRVKALTEKTASHPATYGYYLRDEPTAALYPALAKWSAAVRAAAPKALPYINLFPIYASAGGLGVPTYEEYLEQFVKTVKPAFISYDNYSLMDDGTLRDGYFQNLEAVRAAALRHDLPFWNIVLSNAHFHYAEPTDGGLNFQMYTTLAYGARGIGYFTYFAPAIGNYRLAPIDQFGNKTRTWDMLRRVNLQIHKLAPIYLTLKSVNVFHHPNVPSGCRGMDSSKFLSQLHGGDLMAGEFEGPEGAQFVLVVNKNLHRSTPFGLQFKSSGPVGMVNSYSGHKQPWAGENIWLAPGQGMLLFVQPEKK